MTFTPASSIAAADPFVEDPTRGFRDTFDATCWMSALRRLGFRTVTVSSFDERHSAWHWYAGFGEVYDPKPGRQLGNLAAVVREHLDAILQLFERERPGLLACRKRREAEALARIDAMW